MKSINPATGETLYTYTPDTEAQLTGKIEQAHAGFMSWRNTSFKVRGELMQRAGGVLRQRKDEFAGLMADEMGKVL